MSETEYRYVAARGVEAREPGRTSWWSVDGEEMSKMTAAELRKMADAMDGGDVEKISAELSGGVWEAEARQFKQERDDARSEAVALRATEENLRAQLADAKKVGADLARECADLHTKLAARTDAQPLGWVNVYPERTMRRALWESEGEARDAAIGDSVAVPVYEHPPRPVAPVSDAEIKAALEAAWGDFSSEDLRAAQCKHLRPLFDRAAAVAPDYELVGACVVREGIAMGVWTLRPHHYNESAAVTEAREYGGTPYRLYRGEPIAEATP